MLETGNYAQAAHANGKEGTMTAGMPKTDLFACDVPSSNAILAISSIRAQYYSYCITTHRIPSRCTFLCAKLVVLGWAGLGDAMLFDAFARAAERRLHELTVQQLVNTAWALATVDQTGPDRHIEIVVKWGKRII